MMNDLIMEVTTRTGLPQDQARAAADAVIDFLKQHLPEPAAGTVSRFLNDAQGAQQSEEAKKKTVAAMAATIATRNVFGPPGH